MPYDIRAYLALLLFVPVSLAVMFADRKPLRGILMVYVGGLLFLPEKAAFDFPLIPPIDKNGFAAIMALIGAVFLQRSKLKATKPLRGVELCFLLIIASNIGTALTNADPLIVGENVFRGGREFVFERELPALRPYDAVSLTVRDVLAVLIPFYLGRALLRSREDATTFIRVLVVFGLIYTPLMLLEMRLSPQLHNWVYGYAATAFIHTVRGSGYKATVFMSGGLAVAMFMLAAVLAAATMHQLREKLAGAPAVVALAFLWLVLAISRNVAALLYSVAATPLVLLSRGRLAGRLAVALAVVVVAYPILRGQELVPVDEIAERVAEISPERARSLSTRLDNETRLMDKARERIWFGWGTFGRNRVYDRRGQDRSITDGEWIIRISGGGICGFVGSFSLLLLPIVLARIRIRRVTAAADRRILDALMLLAALNAVDLLPNGLFTRLPYFVAGALAGLARGLSTPHRPG